MLVDAFTFFNELDLLELRLAEMYDVVDLFVLVEAARTFTGRPKPLVYQAHRARFAPWADKIKVVSLVHFPDTAPDAWAREAVQRNAILMGLNGVPDDALVMVSDVDEIPRAGAVRAAANVAGEGFQVAFEMRHSLYHVNNVCYTMTWSGTQMATAGHVRRLTPQGIRDRRHVPAYLVHDAGWHFTGLGGVERLGEKIRSFSHTEVDTAAINNPAHLARCIEQGVDVSGRTDILFRRERLNASYPRYLLDNLDGFAHLVWRSQDE